jgi:hypothetical protein
MAKNNARSNLYDDQKNKDYSLLSKEKGKREIIRFGLDRPLIPEELSLCDLKRLDAAVMTLVNFIIASGQGIDVERREEGEEKRGEKIQTRGNT